MVPPTVQFDPTAAVSGEPLGRASYLGPPDEIARMLLGKVLVRQVDGEVLAGRIVETEAYFGKDDPAAHSFAGRTARTEVLFGPPGRAYVYFIYGVYFCLNVSCEPEGQAGCVLIRALEPLAGIARMAANRGLDPACKPAQLTAGPGRLCMALQITRPRCNGLDLTDPASELRICSPVVQQDCEVAITARINVNKAAERQLRFTLKGNACVSRGKFWKGKSLN